ncbi:MAG: hypothetical protein HY873_11560 [Chloroflexi bacterium]|nr:hypothetical protein [Chloroflexota bacterium]
MEIFEKSQQKDYERYLKQGLAYVCNGSELGEKWTRIHRSDCGHLHKTRTGVTTSYTKYCARELDELLRGLKQHIDFTPVACFFCREAGRVDID